MIEDSPRRLLLGSAKAPAVRLLLDTIAEIVESMKTEVFNNDDPDEDLKLLAEARGAVKLQTRLLRVIQPESSD